jgi:ParB-like chromosome segregation protein Spo0J
MDEYLKYLSDKKINYAKQKLPTRDLKSTQMEFDKDKVAEMMNSSKPGKPIVVSNDGYILDGHHRWLADYNKDKNSQTSAIVVNLPILELMRVSKYYNGVESRPLMESIKKVVKTATRNRKYR